MTRRLVIAAVLATVLASPGVSRAQTPAPRAGTETTPAAVTAPGGTRDFMLVLPRLDGPVFEDLARGCVEAARVAGAVCRAVGPTETDRRPLAEFFQQALTEKPAGIALAGADPTLAAGVVAATRAGIPLVTVDTEFPGTPRQAFVGMNNKDFGRALGASLRRMKPQGGTYAVVAGPADYPAMVERIAGLREALEGAWREAPGSPAATGLEPDRAVKAAAGFAAATPPVDAIVAVGAWPMLAPDAWREFAKANRVRIADGSLLIVVADALPAQRALLKEGTAHVLVTPRLADMGARAAEALVRLSAGRKTPEIVYVGFDVVTRDTP